MSYILEALKKAQAERQLGNAPTIHAQQAVPVAPARAAGGRKPLLVGLGAGALVVAAGALFVWRQAPTAAPPARLDAARTPAPAPVLVPTRAPDALQVSAPSAPARVAEPPIAPAPQVPAAPTSVAQTAAAPAPGRVAEPAVARPASASPTQASAAPARAIEPAARPAPAAPAQVAAAPARATEPAAARPPPPAQVAGKPAPEDSLPFLQQLPDAQQRDIPRVTFGGYMYSANPADRLLLVDKTLRHEGEEVAPGLVLEKLLPKAAVMNYRGLRYRVVY